MSVKLQVLGANVKSCLFGALRMVAKKDNEAHSKALFKRKKGLSKFYANKAQSFSSLDHALSTCMGHSALALEKPKPRSYDASPMSDVDVEVNLHKLDNCNMLYGDGWLSCTSSGFVGRLYSTV